MASIQREPMLFDKIDQEKWKIIDGIISVPKKTVPNSERAFLLQPEYGIKDLSRADKAHLIQAGIRGLLDDVTDIDMSEKDQYEKNMKLELEDPLQASIILIQFLGMRTKIIDFKNSENPNSLFNENFYIPERLYFTLNLFDYPTFKTDIVSFDGVLEKGLSNILGSKNSLVFVRESYLKGQFESKEVTYKFDVDPSLTKNSKYFHEFIKYLFRKSISIDIWDADTLMLYGSVKIPLKSLLRQGRQVATMTKVKKIKTFLKFT